jgi:hypothetical protein
MATNFTPLSQQVQQATTVAGAINTLVGGIATNTTLTGSSDPTVVQFASDLAANSANLANAATYDATGAQKQLGGDARAPYLAAAGV